MIFQEIWAKSRWFLFHTRLQPWHLAILSAVVLFTTMAIYFMGVLPEQKVLAGLKADLSKPLPQITSSPAMTETSGMSAASRGFPHQSKLTSVMREVYAAAAAEGVALDSASYRLTLHKDIRVSRYDVDLPIAGTYPQIRRFLTTVLRDHPNVALTLTSFNRQRAQDAGVKAELHFSVFLSTGTE